MSKFAAAAMWRLFIAQTFIYANWLAVWPEIERTGKSRLFSISGIQKNHHGKGGSICIYIYGTYPPRYVTSPVMTQVCGTFYVCKILQEMVMLCCNFLHWFILQNFASQNPDTKKADYTFMILSLTIVRVSSEV